MDLASWLSSFDLSGAAPPKPAFKTYSGSSPVIDLNGTSCYVNWNVSTTSTSTSTPVYYRQGKAYTYFDLEEAWYDGAACKLAEIARPKPLQPGDTKKLPDGSTLIIDAKGNYRIEDQDAKVTYRANRIRDFSPHLNASDMVGQFIDYVRGLGVRREDVMSLPMELFVHWLVISAAERDQDPTPDGIVPLEEHPVVLEIKKPRCLFCQRFISPVGLDRRFQFCNREHGGRYLDRIHQQQLKRVPIQV